MSQPLHVFCIHHKTDAAVPAKILKQAMNGGEGYCKPGRGKVLPRQKPSLTPKALHTCNVEQRKIYRDKLRRCQKNNEDSNLGSQGSFVQQRRQKTVQARHHHVKIIANSSGVAVGLKKGNVPEPNPSLVH